MSAGRCATSCRPLPTIRSLPPRVGDGGLSRTRTGWRSSLLVSSLAAASVRGGLDDHAPAIVRDTGSDLRPAPLQPPGTLLSSILLARVGWEPWTTTGLTLRELEDERASVAHIVLGAPAAGRAGSAAIGTFLGGLDCAACAQLTIGILIVGGVRTRDSTHDE